MAALVEITPELWSPNPHSAILDQNCLCAAGPARRRNAHFASSSSRCQDAASRPRWLANRGGGPSGLIRGYHYHVTISLVNPERGRNIIGASDGGRSNAWE